MLLVWQINRYSRCYSDSSKQCLDADRKGTIFQYFAHLETQRSLSIGQYWSPINTCNSWKLNLTLTLKECKQVEFRVLLVDTNDSSVILVIAGVQLKLFKLIYGLLGEFDLSKRFLTSIQSIRTKRINSI